MPIATVVTRGYGSFGSVNLLPTRGYAVGVAPPVSELRASAYPHLHGTSNAFGRLLGSSNRLHSLHGTSNELKPLRGSA